jgi:WXXGXW repeat (2 copies)
VLNEDPMKLLRTIARLAALLALCSVPLWSSAQGVGVSVQVAPPALPIYDQPPMPAAGYMWTPGYWAWGPAGYFWVPGTWVLAPAVGLLWTPGYWGWLGGAFLWHGGYWGPHVGFYGGVNYGFGYGGMGYAGGFWRGGAFQYNGAVNNFGSVSVHNTYNQSVINNGGMSRVSFNGGNGGTGAVPTPAELQAANERHVGATPLQTQNEQAASANRSLLASVNHGAPAVAATAHPGAFSGAGVVRARASSVAGSGYQPPPRFQPREPSTMPQAGGPRVGAPAPAMRAPPPMAGPYRAPAPRPQARAPSRPAYRPATRQPAHPAAQPHAQRDERR